MDRYSVTGARDGAYYVMTLVSPARPPGPVVLHFFTNESTNTTPIHAVEPLTKAPYAFYYAGADVPRAGLTWNGGACDVRWTAPWTEIPAVSAMRARAASVDCIERVNAEMKSEPAWPGLLAAVNAQIEANAPFALVLFMPRVTTELRDQRNRLATLLAMRAAKTAYLADNRAGAVAIIDAQLKTLDAACDALLVGQLMKMRFHMPDDAQ